MDVAAVRQHDAPRRVAHLEDRQHAPGIERWRGGEERQGDLVFRRGQCEHDVGVQRGHLAEPGGEFAAQGSIGKAGKLQHRRHDGFAFDLGRGGIGEKRGKLHRQLAAGDDVARLDHGVEHRGVEAKPMPLVSPSPS
jgi:hypothetical protein